MAGSCPEAMYTFDALVPEDAKPTHKPRPHEPGPSWLPALRAACERLQRCLLLDLPDLRHAPRQALLSSCQL